jgi:hypothetical protein
MLVYFDTEFIDDGHTIDLISIGLVREDGKELYLENKDCDLSRADPWVREHVISKLGQTTPVTRRTIKAEVLDFCGAYPEFWGYFADYDWVVFCQLFGRMIDLPNGWPMFCLDVKQEMHRKELKKPEHLRNDNAHNALDDARWTRQLHLWVMEQPE